MQVKGYVIVWHGDIPTALNITVGEAGAQLLQKKSDLDRAKPTFSTDWEMVKRLCNLKEEGEEDKSEDETSGDKPKDETPEKPDETIQEQPKKKKRPAKPKPAE